MIVQALIVIAFAVAVAAAGHVMPQVVVAPIRWLVALAPLALLAWWAWEFYKMVRDDDEMMHVLHLRGVASSAMLVLLGATMWGVLERLLGLPTLPAYLLLPLFAVAYSAISARLSRDA